MSENNRQNFDELDSSAKELLMKLNGKMNEESQSVAGESGDEPKDALGGELSEEKYSELYAKFLGDAEEEKSEETGDLASLLDTIGKSESKESAAQESSQEDDRELFEMMKTGAPLRKTNDEAFSADSLREDIEDAESFVAEASKNDNGTEEPSRVSNVDAYSTNNTTKKTKRPLWERLERREKAEIIEEEGKESGAEPSEPAEAMQGSAPDETATTDPLLSSAPDIFSSTEEENKEEKRDPQADTEMMMLAFGYEPSRDELLHETKDGYDLYSFNKGEGSTSTLDALSDSAIMDEDTEQHDKLVTEMINRPIFEYTEATNSKEVFEVFKSRVRSVRIRMFLSAFIAAILLIWEFVLKIDGLQLDIPFNTFFAVDWLLTFVCALLVGDRMIAAVKNLGRKRVDPDIITFAAFVISIITAVVDIVEYNNSAVDSVYMYNFTFALFAFFNLMSTDMMLSRDIYAFKVISSQKTKRVIARVKASERAREDVAFGEYLSESSDVCKVKKTDFVSDFFANRDETPSNRKTLSVLVPIMLVISVAAFIVSKFVFDCDVYTSTNNAYITFLMCAPMTAFISFAYPAFLGASKAYSHGAAILSEVTPERYENAAVITFSDEDAFPADKIKMKSIKVFDNNSIENVLYYASSVFSKIGGPLATVFRTATLDSTVSDDVQIKELSDCGIDALVNGKHVVVGQPEYMENQCFEIINEESDEECGGKTNRRLLYLACDEVVIAKFCIQYNTSPDFIYIVRHLYDDGVCIAINTIDPCIDSELLYKNRLSPEQYPIKVIKGVAPATPIVDSVSARESGIVSTGSLKGTVKTLLLCDKLISISKTNIAMKLISALIGVIVSGFVIYAKWLGLFELDSFTLYPALYQLFWMIPMYLVSNVYIK